MKKLLTLIFLLFTTLYATKALPTLVPQGESLKDFNKTYYIDKRSPINAIAISEDGKYIVSGSGNSIKIWDRDTGALIRSLEGHTSFVNSVAISSDGKSIVSGSDDGSIKIWDRETGELKRSLEGHTSFVSSVAISSDGKSIVSGSWDKSIKIWDSETGELIRSLEGHTSAVNSVAISSDGKSIVSGSGSFSSNDNSIKIWDSETGELIRSLEGHKDRVNSVAISSDGKSIVSGSRDKSIKIWDSETGALIRSLEGHTDEVTSVAISSDGKSIVSGSGSFSSNDNSIKIWDSETGALKRSLEGHTLEVRSVAISSDGKSIVSGSYDGSIKIWDSDTGGLKRSLEGHTSVVSSVAISSDGKIIVSGSLDDSIKIWDRDTGALIRSLEGHTSFVSSVAISSDGKIIVSGSFDNSIKIWDRDTGELIKSLEGHTKSVLSVAISLDGKSIVSGSLDKSIKIWDSEAGALIRSLEGHTLAVSSVAISSDGKSIVSGSRDKSIKIWDSETGTLIRSLEGHKDRVNSVAISSDGKSIVSGSGDYHNNDKSIKIWDSDTGELKRSLEGHTSAVYSVAISSDGKSIVSGSRDKSIKIWDSETGTLIRSLEGHKDRVNSVAISSDGKSIVSGSWDGSIKIWDSETGELVEEFVGGNRGCWMVKRYNASPQIFYRGDDGTFLLDKKTFKAVQPKWYVEQKSVDDVKLSVKNRHLRFNNNQKAKLVLQLKNLDQNISVLLLNGQSKHFFVREKRVTLLKASETREVALDVFAKVSRDDPKFIDNEELNLSCTTPKGEEFNLSVFVSIDFSTLKVESATLSKDEKTFSVKVRNVGNKALKKAKVKLEAPFSAASQDLESLEVNATETFIFSVPLDTNISIDEKSPFEFSVSIANEEEIPKNLAGTKIAPAYVWHFDNGQVTIVLNKVAGYVYALWALGILLLLGLILYFKVFKNPLVIELSETPNKLKALNGTQLKEASFKLKLINRLKTTLDLADVSEANFNNTIKFFKSNTDEKAERFAKQIGAKCCEKKGEFYQITLAEDFNLNSMKKFLLYVSDENAKKIKHKIVNLNDKVFVIANETEQNAVAKLAKDKTNRVIAPTVSALTELMLSAEAQEKFVTVLSDCLSFKDVSPYQLNGDVKSEKNFFGRIDILREIISNDNSTNYLLVGARKLGKSSIFKALERRYESNEQVVCYNITLTESGDVLIAMAEVLGLGSDAGLEAITTAIKKQTQKPIFLIDEADMFVKNEKENGYLITSVFRKLSQEGDAMFILAGFWTLYEYVTLDYQSPLKNFGKLISLGGLEEEACRALMMEPMERIGVSYEQDEIVDEVVALCGQRANYIATICDVMLRDLKTSTISHEDMQNALESEETDRMLKGWGQLSASEEANRLDRLIVYLTIEQESFRLGDVVEGLKAKALKIDIERVNESLDRLVLGYVVGKHKGNYHYKIPLLKERLIEDDLEFLIEGEVLELL